VTPLKRQIRDSAVALVLLFASVGFAVAAGNDSVASNDRLFLTYAQQRPPVLNGAPGANHLSKRQ